MANGLKDRRGIYKKVRIGGTPRDTEPAGVLEWITDNPVPAAAGAAVFAFLLVRFLR